MVSGIRGTLFLSKALVISLFLTNLSAAQTPKAKTSSGRPSTAGAAAAVPGKATKPAPAAPPIDPARMKLLLKTWEKESSKLKTLDVGILRTDASPLWENEVFKGRAIFQNPNLAWIDFQKMQKNDKDQTVPVPYERIICTGTDVWQYRSDTKEIFIFPLDRQMQKRALEEGPLPFLFNMKAAEAEARYTMDLLRETKDYFVISVIPKLKIDQESFLKAFLQLSRTTYLPEKIYLVSPDGKSSKEFSLNAIQRNAVVNNALFKGVELKKPWQIRRDVPGAQPASAAAPKGAKLR